MENLMKRGYSCNFDSDFPALPRSTKIFPKNLFQHQVEGSPPAWSKYLDVKQEILTEDPIVMSVEGVQEALTEVPVVASVEGVQEVLTKDLAPPRSTKRQQPGAVWNSELPKSFLSKPVVVVASKPPRVMSRPPPPPVKSPPAPVVITKAAPQNVLEHKIFVPFGMKSPFIGKQGEEIKKLQIAAGGARIQINAVSPTQCVVVISTVKKNLRHAIDVVEQRVKALETVTFVAFVPEYLFGPLVGKHGAEVRALREEAQANFKFRMLDDDSGMAEVEITTTQERMATAVEVFQHRVECLKQSWEIKRSVTVPLGFLTDDSWEMLHTVFPRAKFTFPSKKDTREFGAQFVLIDCVGEDTMAEAIQVLDICVEEWRFNSD